ncbi:MAG: HAD-IA family hydrolase [Mycobacteriales bacterium]
MIARWPAVLFDLDGTLTDSGPGIINSVTYALAGVGAPAVAPRALRAFIGPPLRESFVALGIEPMAAIAKYREYYDEIGMFENSVYDGIPPLLEELRSSGVRLGVATSKPTVFAVRILEHFDLLDHFEVVVGDELDGSRRHKHQVIEAALAALGIDSTVAVMIGDREADVLGAARCGVHCIGAGWGYGEPGELATAGAAVIAATPAALRTLLAPHEPSSPD